MSNVEINNKVAIPTKLLPIKCPVCGKRVVRPSTYRDTNAILAYRIIVFIFGVLFLNSLVVFDALIMHTYKYHFMIAAGIGVGSFPLVFIRYMPKYLDFTCDGCNWKCTYLVKRS